MLFLFALLPVTWAALYCPAKADLEMSWNDTSNPVIVDGGWTISGGGGVVTKFSLNLLNGWVSYTIDVTNSPQGVNSNIYAITPKFSGSSYNPKDYCDGNNKVWCVEVDWIESNGFCGGASTLHTVPGTGASQDCNGWGCGVDYTYGGKPLFTMNVSFDAQGHWTTMRDGKSIGALNPVPQQLDWNNLVDAFTKQGVVISSTSSSRSSTNRMSTSLSTSRSSVGMSCPWASESSVEMETSSARASFSMLARETLRAPRSTSEM